jgi:hypothetical protein
MYPLTSLADSGYTLCVHCVYVAQVWLRILTQFLVYILQVNAEYFVSSMYKYVRLLHLTASSLHSL